MMQVLMLSSEPPYPLNGGGPYRTASLLHYFARFAEVDLILISQSGTPALLPPGLIRNQYVIPLDKNRTSTLARYLRNARRAALRVPPLIDRLAGLEDKIAAVIRYRNYDLSIVEHFWCAPYVDLLSRHSTRVLLDLHNVESVLHARCASVNESRAQASRAAGNRVVHSVKERLIAAGHARFAKASRELEAELLPKFSAVLATSEEDATLARETAPSANVLVYPNALPWAEVPAQIEFREVVFSANFEYHPNIDAVEFLIREIWPRVRQEHPQLRLKLVGRGDAFIRHLLPADMSRSGIDVTGEVEDARIHIARSTIVVAPLRAGSGTRIKILEGWAAQRCVVATPLAAEGLTAHDGENIALASGAESFARKVSSLMRNAELRHRLATEGRRTFENNYCWEAVWNRLNIDPQLTKESGLNRYTGIS
jgi:glycosyltransferase involved in cell wall biosynthesis